MIQKFVDRYIAKRDLIKSQLQKGFPDDYEALVKITIEAITDKQSYGDPDPNRIHCIDEGDYQGTLLFIIAGSGYQPSNFWFVKIDYGSCSGCDTLQAIRGYGVETTPTPEQVDDYLTLTLHIVQQLKGLDGESV